MGKKHPQPSGPAAQAETPSTAMAEILQAKGFAASQPTPPPAPVDKTAKALDLSGSGKLVLRRERKGHGGKTVTIVSGLALPAARLELIAREMRKGLGCGSTVEGNTLMLLGDIAPRAEDWLRKHGATKIVIGN